MARDRPFEVTLQLTEIDHFFRRPDISPLSDDYHPYSYTAGIEFISDELYADPSHGAVKLKVLLPEEQITPGLQARVEAAVVRYCAGRLADVNHEIHARRWRGVRALALATVALFVLIIASRLVFSDEDLVRQVISEGLAIAAWVSFWVPLEMLIYRVWEHRLDRKVYRLLSDMEITITATADAGSMADY